LSVYLSVSFAEFPSQESTPAKLATRKTTETSFPSTMRQMRLGSGGTTTKEAPQTPPMASVTEFS
jgi:hypothetical protein